MKGASSKPPESSSGGGEWVKVKQRYGPFGKRYHQQITGLPAENEYRKNGVRFDGSKEPPPVLLEAKGPGYLRFIEKDGKFKWWFRGKDALLKQAFRQAKAADGMSIEWHVAEKEFARALRKLFSNRSEFSSIKIIHTPMR